MAQRVGATRPVDVAEERCRTFLPSLDVRARPLRPPMHQSQGRASPPLTIRVLRAGIFRTGSGSSRKEARPYHAPELESRGIVADRTEIGRARSGGDAIVGSVASLGE
jgi:hypothetical protein